MSDDRLPRPNWTRLPRVVTNRNHKIEISIAVLIGRLAPGGAGVDVIKIVQNLNCKRVDPACRLSARAVDLKTILSDSPEQELGQDAAS